MELTLKESGETSLDHARKANQQLEEGNIEAAKTSLAEAEISAGKHMRKIKYWIECLHSHTRTLSAARGRPHCQHQQCSCKQQSVEHQKCNAETQLGRERNELSRHRSDLSSAEDRLSNARRKAREANTCKVISGIAAGLLTVFSFGAAAPVTAPLLSFSLHTPLFPSSLSLYIY